MDSLVILFIIFCTVCLLALWQSIRITLYFRDKYPTVWATFGYSGNGWWVEAKNEASELIAQEIFRKYLKSEARLNLKDAQLDQMISIARVLNYCGSLFFVVVIVLWVWKDWLNG